MAQAVSRRPLIPETRVQFQVSPRGICDGQSGTVTGFSSSKPTSAFPCQHHSTSAPYSSIHLSLTLCGFSN